MPSIALPKDGNLPASSAATTSWILTTSAAVAAELEVARGSARTRCLFASDVANVLEGAVANPGKLVRARHVVPNSYGYRASSDVVEAKTDDEGRMVIRYGRDRAASRAYGRGDLVQVLVRGVPGILGLVEYTECE